MKNRRVNRMRKKIRIDAGIAALFLLLLFSVDSRAAIFRVPEEYATIRQAIDAAQINDTVLVAPGVYSLSLNIRKNITLGSLFIAGNDSDVIASTILDGAGHSSVITVHDNFSPVIEGVTIRNGGSLYGGGVRITNQASPVIKNCTIAGNSSGIYCYENAGGRIEDCRIYNNNARMGGNGIYCEFNSSPRITGTAIYNNSGCGLTFIDSSDAEASDCIIENNGRKGVSIRNSNCVLRRCIIRSNRDETIGGVSLRLNSNCLFDNCEITDNRGEAFGGIACYESRPSFLNCIISGNTGGSVGGVRLAANSNAQFENCTIRSNHGESYWGAIRIDESAAEFRGCTINNNQSALGCAGIAVNESEAHFRRCLIYDCRSPGEGGAFNCSQSIVSLTNCTVTRNTCGSGGSAVFFEGGGTLTILNTILWNNNYPAIYLEGWGENPGDFPIVNFDYSNIYLGLENFETHGRTLLNWGRYNVLQNCRYVDYWGNDFHLRADSPCIDAGSPETEFDPDGTISDIGAFFYPLPNINVRPEILNFGRMRMFNVDSLPLNVRNIGLDTLVVDTVYMRMNIANYAFCGDVRSFSLNPGETHPLWIKFMPNLVGNHRAAVFLESNDRDSPFIFARIDGWCLQVPGAGNGLPQVFEIISVYPNPFNSAAEISFSTPKADRVKLSIFDQNGKNIHSESLGIIDPGWHRYNLNTPQLTGGVYIIKLENSTRSSIRKAIYLK